MTATIDINGNSYDRIIYKGEPVVTLPMVATLHERALNSVRQNFLRNQERFGEGKDYFQVPYDEWKKVLPERSKDNLKVTKCHLQNDFQDAESCKDNHKKTGSGGDKMSPPDSLPDPKNGGHRGHMIFLTHLGYFKLIKTFNDDLAWDIYIQLVEHYFSTLIRIGGKHQPNPEYVTWLKEQRMGMGEERRFQEFALAEADRLLRTGGDVDDLAHVPILRDAVAAIMRTDPRARQLGLFGD